MRARILRLRIGAYVVLTAIAIMAVACPKVEAQAVPAPPAPDVAQDNGEGDAEHLLRGPMHEAFAAPVTFDPEPGLVIPNEPPDPIEEMPPEVMPERDAIWIPGYWAWDDEREAFLWVSGVYRVPPSGRRWVPGYWQEVENGYQWIPGFWTRLDDDEVRYLPDPPESVERGPSSPAPTDEHFWVNGNWRYDDGRYAWQPGYWSLGHDRWVWIPAYYAWTPRGCVFVPGYWDYQLVDRGMCFAPVYWRQPTYLQAGFFYRPVRVIDLARLHLHLFVRPSYYHYYYGDWYGLAPRSGIYASFAFHGQYGYDPLWSYNRWYFGRQGIDYDARIRGWHRYFESHADRRPPHTWRAQQQFAQRHGDFEHLNRVVLGHDLWEFASRHPRMVSQVGDQERERMRDSARAIREFANGRRDGERDTRPEAERGSRPEADRERLRLPDTPEVRRRRERMAEGRPDRPEERPGQRPEGRPERRPEGLPEGRPEGRPERRPEGLPEGLPERQPEQRPEGRPEGRPQRRPEGQPEQRPEGRPERQPESRPQQRPEGRPGPQPERGPESQSGRRGRSGR